MDEVKNSEFVNRSNSVHANAYDYSQAIYKNMRTKVEVTCKLHGSFLVTPASHIYLESGCPTCGIIKRKPKPRKTTETFIEQCLLIHGDRNDYSKTVYIKSSDKVTVTCKKHGDFDIVAHNHLVGVGCGRCNESKGELAIATLLESYGIKYIREYRIKEHRYFYDFYLPDQNILIEFHGIQHYEPVGHWGGEDGLKKRQIRDLEKAQLAKDSGIPLIVLNVYHLNSKVLELALIRDLKLIYKHWYIFENKLLVFKYTSDVAKYFNLSSTPLASYLDKLLMAKVPEIKKIF